MSVVDIDTLVRMSTGRYIADNPDGYCAWGARRDA